MKRLILIAVGTLGIFLVISLLIPVIYHLIPDDNTLTAFAITVIALISAAIASTTPATELAFISAATVTTAATAFTSLGDILAAFFFAIIATLLAYISLSIGEKEYSKKKKVLAIFYFIAIIWGGILGGMAAREWLFHF